MDLDFRYTLGLLQNDFTPNPLTDSLTSSFHDPQSFLDLMLPNPNPIFLSINIQSLNSKHEKLKNFILSLTNRGIQIDFIAIQET